MKLKVCTSCLRTAAKDVKVKVPKPARTTVKPVAKAKVIKVAKKKTVK